MASAFSIFAVRQASGITLPVVVFGEGADSGLSRDLLKFVRYCFNRGDSYARMKASCNALGLLYDYAKFVYRDVALHPSAIPSVVAGFLRARRNGTIDRSGADPTGLRWRPVERRTVARDRYYLAEYSDFCVRNAGALPLGPMSYRGDELKDALTRLARRTPRDSDLLHHLAHLRRGPPTLEVDIQDRLVARRPSGRSKTYAPAQIVDRMIEATDSVVQKMLLIESYFGGPRLSEMLHQWRCDVLPGRLRKSLFPDDEATDVPLVVLAHPSQSTFLGEKGNGDRSSLLWAKYGLRPRHLIRPDPLWAGWKGIQFDEQDRLVSQIFWTDFDRGMQFYELYGRLRREVYPMVPPKILSSHPYLFINDHPGTASFGLPLKLSNARKIFERAARRIGLEADRFRDGSHAGRHFYKAALKRLGLSQQHIQKCMHHLWAGSQEDYAKSLAEVHEALLRTRPHSKIGSGRS